MSEQNEQYKILIKLDDKIVMCVDEKNMAKKYIHEKSKELKKQLDDGTHEIFEYVDENKITLCTKSKGNFWDGTKKIKHVLESVSIPYIEKEFNTDGIIDWCDKTNGGSDEFIKNINTDLESIDSIDSIENSDKDSNKISETKNCSEILSRYISLKINNIDTLSQEEKDFMMAVIENIDNTDKLMGIYYKHIEILEDLYLAKCCY